MNFPLCFVIVSFFVCHVCKMSAISLNSLFGFCNTCKFVFCTSTEFTRHVEGFPDAEQHLHANSINVLRSIGVKNSLKFVKSEYVVSHLFSFLSCQII